MERFKVALLQLQASRDQNRNLEKGVQACRKAKQMGADLALFPEMYQIGYHFPDGDDDLETWKKNAIHQTDSFFSCFRSLARELKMAIAITYLEKWPYAPRNTVSIIDRYGEIKLTYAKVHTCDFGEERYLARGEDFEVCSLDTEKGSIKLGAMICYDREFPESARILMIKGAEIIIVPNACRMEENRKNQLRTRAFENMTGIALANYALGDCMGHSVAYDGIAFTEDGGSRDTLVVEAGENEGIYLADFDVEMLRRYRERETWGNAYRRPEKYSILISQAVEHPFIRPERTR